MADTETEGEGAPIDKDTQQYYFGLVNALAQVVGRLAGEFCKRSENPDELLERLLADVVEESELWGDHPIGEGARQVIDVVKSHSRINP